jgi:hypothetical protein
MTQSSKGESRRSCFVIAPIGEPGTETRKRSDQLLKHIFVKALEPLGFAVLRADKISEPGMITVQVINRIMDADLVVADMTGHNANVFYELAARHAVEKPVIHVIEAGQEIPFDTADLRTISISLDLEGAENAIEQIRLQARDIESGNVGDTPLKIASIMRRLGENAGEKEILTQILASFGPIKADIQKLLERTGIAQTRLVPPPEAVKVWSTLGNVLGGSSSLSPSLIPPPPKPAASRERKPTPTMLPKEAPGRDRKG